MPTWITGQIIQNIRWTKTLFSLLVRAPIEPFIAGQFTKIKLTINGKNIQRAYSYLNPPYSTYLIFYIANIYNGKLSPFLYKINSGSTIQLTKKSYGYFTLNKIPHCKNLWMIATGTGIAPFLSILTHGTGIKKFKHIILIHTVRCSKHLHYLDSIHTLQKKYHHILQVQIIFSQEKSSFALTGYVQDLINDGSLEKKLNLQLEPENNHIMLCGNPNMIKETIKILQKKYNMKIHSHLNPGNITIERYW